MSEIEVILVDDHKIVRDGIIAFTLGHKSIKIIGEAGNESDLLKLLEKHVPDVIVMDVSLPGKDGIEITKEILVKYPSIKVLMLSAWDNEKTIKDSVKAGAMGFLHKDCEQNEFLSAIEKIFLNQCYFGNHLSSLFQQLFIDKKNKMLLQYDTDEELTSREKEVLKYLAQGFGDKQIADVLFISKRTVETHKKHIREKLDLKTTAELVIYAIQNRIIDI